MPRSLPLLLICALLAAAPAASASTLLERQAAHLGAVDYHAFLLEKEAAPPPFDWSTDGCTKTPPAWGVTFDGPCQQHDFGYRNMGHGLRLRPTEVARLMIDRRLLTELRRVCAERFAALEALRCRVRARAMYTAVRLFNPPWS
jgi:Prokaryotic phospholipase A2